MYDVWLINAAIQVISPYAAGTWLGRWYAASYQLALAAASAATGNAINTLQATPVAWNSNIQRG